MANIAIVNYCNLKCKYCFADDMIQEQTVTISLEDYCRILEFMARTPDNQASCGCNIHPGCKDYSYMWDIVDRYKLNHIRCSVVSPAACYEEWRKDKEGYYNMMKPVFLQFCEDAIKHNCRLGMDCGHIPMCYFTAGERETVESICDNLYQDFCSPVTDITPDFKATACFGAYDPVDIRDFHNIFELERCLMLKKTYPKVQANCTGRCTTCRKHKLLQCQGGCLGFADTE